MPLRPILAYKPLIVLALAALSTAIAAQDTALCTVVGVSDGDTFTCLTAEKKQIKVRLAEIDTPEKAQPYGQKSRQALAGMVHGKPVSLDVVTRDRYGRTVARVHQADLDVNRELVSVGAAWVYRQYNRDKSLLAVEADAREARRGLWSLPEVDRAPPWEWRRTN